MDEWMDRKEDLEELFGDELGADAYSIVSHHEARKLAGIRQQLLGFEGELSEDELAGIRGYLVEKKNSALMYLGMIEMADETPGDEQTLEVWEELAKGRVAELKYLISATDEALD